MYFDQMYRVKGLRCFAQLPLTTLEGTKWSISPYSMAKKHRNGVSDPENIPLLSLQPQRGNAGETLSFAKSALWIFKLPHCSELRVLGPKPYAVTVSRQYGQGVQACPNLNRDFLVQLWVADKKMKRSRGRRRRKIVNYANHGEAVFGNQPSFQDSLGRWFSATSVTGKESYGQVKQVLKQPPPSQAVTGILEPASMEEVKLGLPLFS
ncbi:unnamed protein product [Ilex paraguariensis]|uniref:Uncharacterized protein n=1 Tax=Ilex paraguariensis TaxID=185542 RepID=A0ABC8RNL8_9AQUA